MSKKTTTKSADTRVNDTKDNNNNIDTGANMNGMEGLTALLQAAVNPENNAVELKAKLEAAQEEMDAAKVVYDEKRNDYQQIRREYVALQREGNKVKGQLSKIADTLGINPDTLGIDLTPTVTSPARSTSIESDGCLLYVNGKPSPNARQHTLSGIAASVTGNCGGSASSGRYTKSEMVTKLELAGIDAEGSWIYTFKNKRTVYRFNPRNTELQTPDSSVQVILDSELKNIKEIHARLIEESKKDTK